MNTKTLARAAVVAALYVLLTVALQAFSFGPIQLRVAEAMTLLPILSVGSVPGLAVGCLLANLLGGAVWYDVVLGSAATLCAACLTRRFRARPAVAAAMPVLMNALVVGPVVYFAYVLAPGEGVNWSVLWSTIATVGAGEAVSVYLFGFLMLAGVRKLPARFFD